MSSISVVTLGHGETKRFIFLGDCHGSLLGTLNLTTAHLIANHLIVARLIGTHLVVIHLIANHLVASHRIVTIATIPQVSDFADRCTNLGSGKREGHVTCIEIVLLVHPNFFILSNWQLKKTYGKLENIVWDILLLQAFRMESENSENLQCVHLFLASHISVLYSYQISLRANHHKSHPIETVLDWRWDFHVGNLAIAQEHLKENIATSHILGLQESLF